MVGARVLMNSSPFRSAAFPCITREEGSVLAQYYPSICIDEDPPKPPSRAVYRARPTGERGSGPYFISYKKADFGVDQYGYSPISYGVPVQKRYVFDWNYVYRTSEGHLIKYYSDGHEAYNVGFCSPMSAYPNYVFFNYVWRSSSKRLFYSQQLKLAWSGDAPRASSIEEAERWMRILLPDIIEGAAYPLSPLELSQLDKLTGFTVVPLSEEFNFQKGELDAFWWHDLTGVLPGAYQMCATQSYIEAANAIPAAECNTIANVMEIAGKINSLRKGDLGIATNAADIWLQYRYEYTTTKADILEYADLTQRLTNLARTPSAKLTGVFEKYGISCRTVASFRTSDVLPSNVKEWLETYGFKFSALNMWDMVPYSFIADWFFHIGDILDSFEKQGEALSAPLYNVWHTFQTEYDNQFTMFRIPKTVRYSWPHVSYSSTSTKTLGKRVTDGLALFLA